MFRRIIIAAFFVCLGGDAFGQTACEKLRSLALSETQITFARETKAGAMLGAGNVPIESVPAFCRAGGVIRPTHDSEIRFEVWMPVTGWNGKFRATGNGGFAGSINFAEMAGAVRDGYATASTDTGHSGSSIEAGWALGHPEKIVDFGYRAVHEMTAKAKAVIQAYYGTAAKRSYFAACSNGGREGLMEAQRFPEDYDGILAGAPANYWTHLVTANFYNAAVPMLTDKANEIPAKKIPAISRAVLAACDAQDGLKDGVINDPRECHFLPAALLCKGADADSCLTAAQAAELNRIYRGARSAQGEQIYPGYMPGGEDGPQGWEAWIVGKTPGQSLGLAFSFGFLRNMLFDDEAWMPGTSTLEASMSAADRKLGAVLNAIDPDLRPFKAHGGKLILYHGWSDAAIPPLNAVEYYDAVVKTLGQDETNSFGRLYMAPGMQHCAGGPGANLFGQFDILKPGDARHDVFTALDEWVEKDAAPQSIVASKFVDDDPTKPAAMTRPLCPYPQVAQYKGTGDSNSDANFVCGAADKQQAAK